MKAAYQRRTNRLSERDLHIGDVVQAHFGACKWRDCRIVAICCGQCGMCRFGVMPIDGACKRAYQKDITEIRPLCATEQNILQYVLTDSNGRKHYEYHIFNNPLKGFSYWFKHQEFRPFKFLHELQQLIYIHNQSI